jgi:hypothetical protein
MHELNMSVQTIATQNKNYLNLKEGEAQQLVTRAEAFSSPGDSIAEQRSLLASTHGVLEMG